jgi:voltage-gated potassium channel
MLSEHLKMGNPEVIIYGYSKLAAEISSALAQENYKFLIIEPDLKIHKFAVLDRYTQEIYTKECYDDDEFITLGICNPSLKALYCLHNDFNRNLFITLSARNLNQDIQIIALSSSDNETKKLKLAGASVTINPYEIVGLRIFRQIDKPISIKLLEGILHKNSEFLIREILITKGSILNGLFSKEIEVISANNLILLGVQDKEIGKEFIFSSRGINHKIDDGDIIVVLGKEEDVKNFEAFLVQNQK